MSVRPPWYLWFVKPTVLAVGDIDYARPSLWGVKLRGRDGTKLEFVAFDDRDDLLASLGTAGVRLTTRRALRRSA